MEKFTVFTRRLSVLQQAEFNRANYDDIYRTGIIVQFNLTFELAWKCLQSVLQMHSVAGAETGSPREILKLGYQTNFLQDADVWLLMLKKRNLSVHIYDEEQIDELIVLIRDSFVPAFLALAETIKDRIAEAESNTWE